MDPLNKNFNIDFTYYHEMCFDRCIHDFSSNNLSKEEINCSKNCFKSLVPMTENMIVFDKEKLNIFPNQ